MDIKTAFLNGDLDEEVYIKQLEGFVMPVGRLSRFTSNASRQHWQAITRVFKYLKGTMNYGLSYMGYPLVLEGYSDASWINHVEDSSSTSGWVFLLGGALVAASKEAEWLRNLIHEIPIWPKPIAPISMNGVISIEFVRSQKNLADHLTKGLARDGIKVHINLLSMRYPIPF
ncbi:hypothetical protein Tco_1148058 [Tanacetum coccineum]